MASEPCYQDECFFVPVAPCLYTKYAPSHVMISADTTQRILAGSQNQGAPYTDISIEQSTACAVRFEHSSCDKIPKHRLEMG